MPNNEAIVRDFFFAWSRLDPAEIASYFCEDGVYHNMPAAPVAGRAQIQACIARFSAPWTKTEWEVLNLLAHDDIVIAERLDRTLIADKQVHLPCCGVFEMERGKIKVWRDYFDMVTYTRATSG